MIIPPNTLVHNRYHIERLIAQGGMGAVYKALDKESSTIVAIKQSLVKDKQLQKAFEREARMLARLRHPVLPVVSDHFTDESGQFLVMEYIPGDDLGTLLERQSKKFLTANALPWVLSWADQLLDGLAYLHNQEMPILHRDIKPQNLKITRNGEIKLLDFGLAKSASDHTMHSAVKSVRGYTPQYAPLEQIQGTGTEPRSDLYSLAATLYHLLTGQAPPDSLDRVAALLGGQHDPLRPANELNQLVPPSIALILHQAMEQEKAHRFASAMAMRTALRMANPAKKRGSTSTSTTGRSNMSNMSGISGMTGDSSSGMRTIVSTEPELQAAPRASAAAPVVAPLTQRGIISQPMVSQAQLQRNRTTTAPMLPPTIVVDQLGQGDFKTIGEAIMAAKAGARVRVRPGTYREGILIDKPVDVSGEGAVEQIIVESTGGSCVQMRTDYARIRGITLRGRKGNPDVAFFTVDISQGRLVLEQCDIAADTNACVAVYGADTNPMLWRCKIHDARGTGIVFFEQARGIVEECDIYSHAHVGIGITEEANPIIRRCSIHHCRQHGINVSEAGRGIIDECDIAYNEHNGIDITQDGHPYIRGSQLHDQLHGYGISVYDGGKGFIEQCDVYENTEAGVGITHNGMPLLLRCTIHNERNCAIIITDGGNGTIDDCTISHNETMSVCIGKESNPTFRNCTIMNNKQHGMIVRDGGQGIIEACTITHHAFSGIDIQPHGNPVVRYSTINNNKRVAIQVQKQGAGTVESCDLTGNKRGAWLIEEGSLVLANGNRE